MSDLSNTAVNNAARILRDHARGRPADPDVHRQARHVLLKYRGAHQYALTKAAMGLRSVVLTENCRLEISQRLKRVPTIIDKLARHESMKLTTMQDIGGCRAVLADLDEVERVRARFSRNRTPSRVDDYIANPRPTGYRAVHLVVTYPDRDSVDRRIEVQLRTQVMQRWAVAVETSAGRLREDLKGGRGPQEVLDYFHALSEAWAMEERLESVPPDLLEQIDRLRQQAVPWLAEEGRHE